MNSKDIYQALKNKNLNITILAVALEVSPQAVSAVIKKGKGSERIAKAIAESIEEKLEIVFPYYSEKQVKKDQREEKIKTLKERFSKLA